MSEAHDYYREVLEAARLKVIVAETNVRVMELAVLLSVEAVVRRAEIEAAGGVPREQLAGVPDPEALLSSEEDITAGEAVRILRDFFDMSDEGEARLWRLL